MRVPWATRRSNQSILKEISPEYSLEWLILKLKLQHFGHLMQTTDSLEKTLILGKIERRRKRGWKRMRWLNGITDLIGMNLSGPQELVMDREAWRAVVNWVAKSWTRLRDWTNWLNRRGFAVLSFNWKNVYSVKPCFLLICTKAFGFSPVSEYNFEQDNSLS